MFLPFIQKLPKTNKQDQHTKPQNLQTEPTPKPQNLQKPYKPLKNLKKP